MGDENCAVFVENKGRFVRIRVDFGVGCAHLPDNGCKIFHCIIGKEVNQFYLYVCFLINSGKQWELGNFVCFRNFY